MTTKEQTNEYHEYVLNDVLGHIKCVTSKRMFGGYGYYLDGRIFAFIVEGELYFKADEETSKDFEELGSEQFIYDGHKNKGPVAMPYWKVPEEIMNDREKIEDWAVRSSMLSEKKK